ASVERFAAATDCRDAIAAWQEFLRSERRASPHTVAAYCGDLARFCDFLRGHLGAAPGRTALAGLRAGDFRAYLAHRPGEDTSRPSLARAMSVLRQFFRFLDRRGLVHNAALATVRSPKLPVSVPKPVTAAEADEALSAVDAIEPWIAARDTAILTLLYG